MLEQHNTWLNQELTEKVSTLLKEKRSASDMEMEMRSKLTMVCGKSISIDLIN